MNSRPALAWAHGVFWLSGVCGLGCQVLWTRLFAPGLGQELPAVLAVVAAFFGGFTLGAAGAESLLRRVRLPPAAFYAALEAVIGLWVLASPTLIPRANLLALDWIGLEPSLARHAAVAFGVPWVTLLPATAAMGATLAVFESFARGLSAHGRVVGSLYAANTLGAAVGALAVLEAGFRLGFTDTLRALGLLNLVCAGAALWLGRRATGGGPTQGPARPGAGSGVLPAGESPGRLRALLWATGLLGIGLEVLGVRLLKLVLENTSYTFAGMLAVYLLGTAVGAAGSRRLAARWPALGRVEVWLGGLAVACVLSGVALAAAPGLYEALRRAGGDSFTAVWLAELTVAASVFLPASWLMGATFAHLAQRARDGGFGLGRALAWNTLGGALAPVGFGAGLFPAVGAKGTLTVLAVGYGLLALAAAGRWRRAWLLAPLAAATWLLPDLRLVQLLPGERLRVVREGVSDTVVVVATPPGHRTLRVNNRFTMGGTAAATAERRQAHLPLLLHPGPRRALFLGSGTGITAAAATAHPGLEVDSVELVPDIVAVMPEFAPENAAPPGRLRQFTADARRFLRATPARYDVIVADLFHPGRDGAGALYTREHFQAVRDRLAPGGLFCQWVPLYQVSVPTFERMVSSVRAVFPHVRAFLLRPTLDTPALGLVASVATVSYPADWWEQRVGPAPELRAALQSVGLNDTVQLLGGFVADADDWAPLPPPDSDERQTVNWLAARRDLPGPRRPEATLFALLARPARGPETLLREPAELGLRLRAYAAARHRYLEGLRLEAGGHDAAAREAFVESARLSADFTTGYAHALTLAVQMSADNPAGARRLLEALAAARPERPVAGELLKKLFSPAPDEASRP
jgi:spermidine synthase